MSKQTSFYISEELKKEMQIYCIKHNITKVNTFIVQAIKEKLDREEKQVEMELRIKDGEK